jgi:uncharacterized protein
MSRAVTGVVRAAARRPATALALAAVLVAVGAALALRLSPSAATDTLASRGSPAYEATARLHARFGDDPVAVLVREDLAALLLTKDLNTLIGLEGCLSGRVPRGHAAPGGAAGPCAQLARMRAVRAVYGPGTFINSAVGEIQDRLAAQLRARTAQAARAGDAAWALARAQGRPPAEQRRLARAAQRLVYAKLADDLVALNGKYGLGLTSAPRIDDPDLIASIVFDPSRGARTPKARFASLFPSSRSALISVRLEPDLGRPERARAVALVRAAAAMPRWRFARGNATVVTGAPVLADDLAGALGAATLRLLAIGIAVMGLVLALLFGARPRLLPLALALGAVAIAFGGLSTLGAPLTLAAIAVLPVLLGLGVDYAIQYQARLRELGPEGAGRRAAPTIATAALATGAGFLALLLSPVPMVRAFGLLLIGGVAAALALALTAGTAAVVLAGRAGDGALARALRGAGDLVDAGREGAGRALAGPGRLARCAGRSALGAAVRRPQRVLAAGLALAALGWAADWRTEVVSDLQRLVPASLPAVRDLGVLQRETGVAGEVDVVVEGPDLTAPAAVRWMRRYQAAVLARHPGELRPALSLADLFRTPAATASRARIRAVLAAVPASSSRAVITPDRRTAVLAFGVRLEPLARQRALFADLRAWLRPPPGVRARLGGLPVLAADADHALADPWRRLGTLVLGLLAVGLVLLGVHRRWARAWVPLVPVALATGWSALVLSALRVPLNPLSAGLGALVLALATEFAVLLTARFREERDAGWDTPSALRRTYRSTGAAVATSGTTAIAGFAVLIASDVRLLRDFGLVTVVDLGVSLLGVLAVLPAVLVLAERRAARRPAPRPATERPAVPA